MKTLRKYAKTELYKEQDRVLLLEIINNLSFMALNDKQKSTYCNLAYKHCGLNIDMIKFNCTRCGIKNCKVKKSVYEMGF